LVKNQLTFYSYSISNIAIVKTSSARF